MPDMDHNVRITRTFHKLLAENGLFSPRSIAWNSTASQVIRFKVLAEIGNLKHQSVLDIGSGLGDLYNYLKPFSVKYTGIELSLEFTTASRNKYPGINVINDDFMTHVFQKKFDWIFCSGAFNIKIGNSDSEMKKYVFSAIEKMWSLAKKGVAFNLPNKNSEISNDATPFDKELDVYIYYFDPLEIVTFCQTLTNNVVLKIGYLPHDFSIYMYR